MWNGRDNKTQVFSLLEYLPTEPYEALRNDYFAPLEAAVLDGSLSSKAVVLDYYASLTRQWGVKLRTCPTTSTSKESKLLTSLITHAESLALSTLESPPTDDDYDEFTAQTQKPAALSVIEFYGVLAELFSHASLNANIRLTIPPAPTVYSIAFTPIVSLISILCSVLANYKSSFETSLSSEVLQIPNPPGSLYPTHLVGQFNGYVMDICNLIWRNRALNTEDPNALGCLISPTTVTALTQYTRNRNEVSRKRKREAPFNYNFSSLYSLSQHAALCNLSAACFADIEEESHIGEMQPRLRKPVTQKALNALEKDGGVRLTWQEYRVRMIDWLDGMGSRGIANLMRSTMKALRKE